MSVRSLVGVPWPVSFRFYGIGHILSQFVAAFPHGLSQDVLNLGVDAAKVVRCPPMQCVGQLLWDSQKNGLFFAHDIF